MNPARFSSRAVALALVVLSAFVIPSWSTAAESGVDSRITAVTVYADRAVVTRTATADLQTGTSELVFANLPQSLNENSLQVTGRGSASATILDVSAKRTYVDFTPNERVKALEEQHLALLRQQRDIADRAALLHSQQGMIDRMEAALVAPPSKEVPRPDVNQLASAMGFIVEQRTSVSTGIAALDDQRADLERKLTTVLNQLNELRGAGGRAYKTVTVRVAVSQPGKLNVALSYAVPGATWMPSYDTRVLASDRAVDLGYFGVVRQSTGEDWNNVQLTLSTARPSLGGAAPELTAWRVDVHKPETIVLEPFSVRRERAPRALAQSAAGDFTDAPKEEADDKDAGLARAAVESGATNATFRIAVPASVASDNSPQRVPITSSRMNAQPQYDTTPKRLTSAFLTSKVYNNTEFPLLTGPMNVFLDGTFVATSRLSTVQPGEKFDLALGADDGISVQHKRVNRFSEDTGLISSGKRITYEYLITVQNNKRTAEKIVVTDHLPVSGHEKIVVKQLTPDPREVKPDKEGLLKWTLDLKPGEKREITLKFSVEHPDDTPVIGLED